MELKEIGINTRNWINSARDRDYWRALVNVALNCRFPKAMELVIIRLHLIICTYHIFHVLHTTCHDFGEQIADVQWRRHLKFVTDRKIRHI